MEQPPGTNQTQNQKNPEVVENQMNNDASNTLQQPDPNTGAGGVQTLPITVALPTSITDPPSTWNGSATGTVVKMSEKLSMWCIAQIKI
ncbi:CIR protein PIR protein, fragment [Plasmodium vinckei petteri]|uniref:CIR protein PIR protein n=1 Tax=Plasmodium vinckei petteri TaxID=138298 RepID=A0A6V7T9P1_PLAVN|nr:CIR protein PIR protein, fragment [Plasmodium vinckei petteri]